MFGILYLCAIKLQNMATVKAFIKPTKGKLLTKVRFYISRGRGNKMLYWTSEIDVNPEHWDVKKEEYKAKILFGGFERAEFNKSINYLKDVLLCAFNNAYNKDSLTSKLFESEVDKQIHPEKYKPLEKESEKQKTFFELFDEFLAKHKISDVRKKNYKVVKRALQRFELYKKLKNANFEMTLNNLTPDLLLEIEGFLKNEYKHFEDFPDIYLAFPECRAPKERGRNTISGIFTKIRTFVLWSVKNGKTTNDQFDKFKIDECIYGTPYFLTIDERNAIYHCDLSSRPQLAIQRDIFIFQCWVGCRMGDLYSLKKSSVINGGVEYIQQKTQDESPRTIRVTLSKEALEIINIYSGSIDDKLFPLISRTNYNLAIKEVFTEAKITRVVTVINPTNGKEEKKPLNEIAASHLARRTFIGNLYKLVKDQRMVSSVSGHSADSKAFGRYIEVDDEMKIDMMKLLE